MDPVPLTVVIPTLDEEPNLAACLDSVTWADEVLVIDSGSRDATTRIARKHGASVIERAFTGYGDQRNHAAAAARHDWILCVDADERVSAPLQREIEAGMKQGFDRPGYRIRRETRFAGRVIRHCGWQRDRVLRLYDRRRGRWDDRLVHERVTLEGDAGDLAAPLLHLTYRDLFQYAEKSRRYAQRGALELYRRGVPARPLGLLLLPAARFLKMYVAERGFLDGVPGLLLCTLASYGVFLKYARLWEIERSGGSKERSDPTVALSSELLEILACPVCKVSVKLTADTAGLKCEKCLRVYPIRDDIPVMLVEEAKVEGA